MKQSIFLKALVLTFASISSASAATFTVDFDSLIGAYPNPLAVTEFFTISSTGGEVSGFSVDSTDLFGNPGGAINRAGGPPIIFAFDTSKVNVTSILVGGISNNSPVQIDAFGSLLNDTISTSNNWTEISQISGLGNISQVDITLLESSITSFQFEYTVVPVPAAMWLFGSGLLGLVGFARRRGNARV